jgi:hypothetical protein
MSTAFQKLYDYEIATLGCASLSTTVHVALCHCEERSDEAISFRHSSEIYETLYY